jgi:hypothetical protein
LIIQSREREVCAGMDASVETRLAASPAAG